MHKCGRKGDRTLVNEGARVPSPIVDQHVIMHFYENASI